MLSTKKQAAIGAASIASPLSGNIKMLKLLHNKPRNQFKQEIQCSSRSHAYLGKLSCYVPRLEDCNHGCLCVEFNTVARITKICLRHKWCAVKAFRFINISVPTPQRNKQFTIHQVRYKKVITFLGYPATHWNPTPANVRFCFLPWVQHCQIVFDLCSLFRGMKSIYRHNIIRSLHLTHCSPHKYYESTQDSVTHTHMSQTPTSHRHLQTSHYAWVYSILRLHSFIIDLREYSNLSQEKITV